MIRGVSRSSSYRGMALARRCGFATTPLSRLTTRLGVEVVPSSGAAKALLRARDTRSSHHTSTREPGDHPPAGLPSTSHFTFCTKNPAPTDAGIGLFAPFTDLQITSLNSRSSAASSLSRSNVADSAAVLLRRYWFLVLFLVLVWSGVRRCFSAAFVFPVS